MYAAAQAVGVRRLVYISSGSVHGQSPAPGTDETSPLHVRHAFAYNTAKVRAERTLRQLRRRGTVELVILRPTIVFGPGSRWVFDFADALRAGTACLVDGARGVCNSIYVDNLGYAVLLALKTPGIDGEVFLINDREAVSWRDLFQPIADGLGYDINAVPNVSPPVMTPSFKDTYVRAVRTSEFMHRVLSLAPASLKATFKTTIRRIRGRRPAPSRGEQPVQPASALHRHGRDRIAPAMRVAISESQSGAASRLRPARDVAEGCQRSVQWLLRRNGSIA